MTTRPTALAGATWEAAATANKDSIKRTPASNTAGFAIFQARLAKRLQPPCNADMSLNHHARPILPFKTALPGMARYEAVGSIGL